MYDLNLPARNMLTSTAELVDRAFEERAVVAVAFDQHEALRIEIDLIGVRGDVVLRLIVAFAERDALSCRSR